MRLAAPRRSILIPRVAVLDGSVDFAGRCADRLA